MNNLRHYPLNEGKSGPKQGFVMSISGHNGEDYWASSFAGVTEDFYSFSNAVLEQYVYPDFEHDTVKDVDELADLLTDALELKYFQYQFWHGLVPKSQEKSFLELDIFNPYAAVSELDDMFTNAKSIMAKLGGNESDLSYIARAVESTPAALRLYANEPRYEKILKMLKMDPKKKQALVTLHNIKGMY